jgi:hypothetical protein
MSNRETLKLEKWLWAKNEIILDGNNGGKSANNDG